MLKYGKNEQRVVRSADDELFTASCVSRVFHLLPFFSGYVEPSASRSVQFLQLRELEGSDLSRADARGARFSGLGVTSGAFFGLDLVGWLGFLDSLRIYSSHSVARFETKQEHLCTCQRATVETLEISGLSSLMSGTWGRVIWILPFVDGLRL